MDWVLLLFYVVIISVSSPLPTSSKVILGNEQLRNDGYAILNGERVAVLSNPTGVYDDTLIHIVDDMYNYQQLMQEKEGRKQHKAQIESSSVFRRKSASSSSFELVAIFSPEHGFRGELQAETGDPLIYFDSYTHLPVFRYSLYCLQL